MSTFYGDSYINSVLKRAPTIEQLADNIIRINTDPVLDSTVAWSNLKLRFELDTEKNCMPVGIELLNPDKTGGTPGTPITEFRNALIEWKKGIWAPKSAEKTIYNVGKDGKAYVMSKVTVTVVEEQSHFNVDIDPSIFKLQFPPGTVVYDDVTKKNYISDKGDKRDYDAYVKKVKAQLSGSVNGEVSTNPDSGTMWRRLFLGANIIVIVVLLFFVLRRLLQRRVNS